MAELQGKPKHDLRAVSRALFESAKRWWAAAVWCKFGVFAITAIPIFFASASLLAALAAALVYLVSEFCGIYSDTLKGDAESLLRKLDNRESFGWQITGIERTDYLSHMPARLWDQLPEEGKGEHYFLSDNEPGPVKAVENAQESAWWTRYVAGTLWKLCIAGIVVLVLVLLVVLIASLPLVGSADARTAIARTVLSTVTLVFSSGLARLAYGYYKFSAAAARTVEKCESLLTSDRPVDFVETVKVWSEYQLARAGAPLLPSWIWKWKSKERNRLWKLYRSSYSGVVNG